MPPRKRLASAALESDTDGALEPRVRPCFDGIFIPDDIVRLLLEFLSGQRRCAQFGADARVLDWQVTTTRLRPVHMFRAINRQWARLASPMVRRLYVPRQRRCKPSDVVAAFPNIKTVTVRRCNAGLQETRNFDGIVAALSAQSRRNIHLYAEVCETSQKIAPIDCRGYHLHLADYPYNCCHRGSGCFTPEPRFPLQLVNFAT